MGNEREPDAESIDTGEPIRELDELAGEPSDRLLRSVLDSIRRRDFASSVIGLIWSVPIVVIEYLGVLFGDSSDERRENEEK